jgi:para-nitrobenzyl esterase
MNRLVPLLIIVVSLFLSSCEDSLDKVDTANTKQGWLKGYAINQLGVVSFKGIPYAQPPLGEYRWQAPQPPLAWKGVKSADDFGHKCMQEALFNDMQFRASGMSEDCLFLNIWTPLEQSQTKLPVLVYFYGGGFVAGDGSESRYDGANMATKGIVTVTVNYRLGVFGFMAHPELSAESSYAGSGNYGLLDQQAALVWVAQNIEAFGGDPKRITIAGESAGSISASAQTLASDSIPYIAGVIGESGSIMGSFVTSLYDSEQLGLRVAEAVHEGDDVSIAGLRAIPADLLLDRVTKAGLQWFTPTIDGKLLVDTPQNLFSNKKFADVPLLVGVNSQEGSYSQLFADAEVTPETYLQALQQLYPEHYSEVAALYPGQSPEQIKHAAQQLMSDRFISASTWKWIDAASSQGQAKTFYYLFDHIRPPMKASYNEGKEPSNTDLGAVHSAEIEYVLGNLDANHIYKWKKADYQVSEMTQQYFINFIKTGNPNGEGLVTWPAFEENKQLVIKLVPEASSTLQQRQRYKAMAALQVSQSSE